MAKPANIFVIIDGLGWEWIQKFPFLESIAPYRRPMESILGYSVGAIPSILTGRHPDDHGRMTLFLRAQNGDSPFRIFSPICRMPPAMVDNRYVRHVIKRAAQKIHRFSGYFILYGIPLRFLPLLDVCEKRDIYQPGGIAGSSSIFDCLVERGSRYYAYSYHQGSDADLIKMMTVNVKTGDGDFYFLYLAGIDAYLHTYGDSDMAGAADRFKWYSNALTSLYETARAAHGSAHIHVFSDHGMAPTRKTSDVQSKLVLLPYSQPTDYMSLLDSTMGRFWFSNPAAKARVMDSLDGSDGGVWLSEAELRKLHAWFDDHRYGEEIYLMPEGTVIAPSHMSDTAPLGMHGFHPDTAHSKAVLISSQDYGSWPEHITDGFRLMRECF